MFAPRVIAPDQFDQLCKTRAAQAHIAAWLPDWRGRHLSLLKNDGYSVELRAYADDVRARSALMEVNAKSDLSVFVYRSQLHKHLARAMAAAAARFRAARKWFARSTSHPKSTTAVAATRQVTPEQQLSVEMGVSPSQTPIPDTLPTLEIVIPPEPICRLGERSWVVVRARNKGSQTATACSPWILSVDWRPLKMGRWRKTDYNRNMQARWSHRPNDLTNTQDLRPGAPYEFEVLHTDAGGKLLLHTFPHELQQFSELFSKRRGTFRLMLQVLGDSRAASEPTPLVVSWDGQSIAAINNPGDDNTGPAYKFIMLGLGELMQQVYEDKAPLQASRRMTEEFAGCRMWVQAQIANMQANSEGIIMLMRYGAYTAECRFNPLWAMALDDLYVGDNIQVEGTIGPHQHSSRLVLIDCELPGIRIDQQPPDA